MKQKVFPRYPAGNPRRVWKQDHLILNTPNPGPMTAAFGYASGEEDIICRKTRLSVKTAVDAGFTMIGCLWADSRTAMEIVRAAESLGADVLFQDLHRFGGMGSKNILCETNDYENVIAQTRNRKCIKGYCMWDEPILEEHLAVTRKMIDYCEKTYPDMLPYTVANPDYNALCRWQDGAYVPYIRRFLEVLDPAQMDFDYYPIGREGYDPALQLDNFTIWADLEIVRREAAKKDIPMWFAYQGQEFPWHPVRCAFHFAMARCMAHAGILHGAKGLECYTEFDGFVDPATGGPGVFFEEQKRLNTELRTLGNTLMALKCQRVIHDDSLLPGHPFMEGFRTPMEESGLLTGTLDPRISVSEHTDIYGNTYLMVLNRDYEKTARIRLRMKQTSHIFEVSKQDGRQYLRHTDSRELPLRLEPGDLVLCRVQPAAEEPFAVEYYLEKD